MRDGGVDPEAAEALLRRFEPVLRFTRGEQFYPMDVEPYVQACSLWVRRNGEQSVCILPRGELTLDNLAQQPRDDFGAVHYLRFTDPKSFREVYSRGARAELRRRRQLTQENEGGKKVFRAGKGRLARVGYTSRFADALYEVALLARGRVPGESTAAASVAYGRIMDEGKHYGYHGRVLRHNGWTVLQYWLFYAFNDWRSGFFGANDHEADWEKIMVYLSEPEAGEFTPEWVAYAAHEYTGDNLRRRWDDPEVEKVKEHPVVYVGAGSHASFYAPGEYLTELDIRVPRPMSRASRAVRGFWREKLRQYSGGSTSTEGPGFFHIPFVDYARGDGLSVGPGQGREWDPPRLMQEPEPPWVRGYRGLWGLYTRDPFEGEDAPAGPMYLRDKNPDPAWHDPVGWAGLDKVPTREEALRISSVRQREIEARHETLRAEIEEKSRRLKELGVETAALRGRSHLDDPYEARARELRELSVEVARLRADFATGESIRESLEDHAGRLESGDHGPLRTHITHAHQPASDTELRTGRVAEAWAALSVGLMLISLLSIVVLEREHLIGVLVASIALFAFVEAGFRGRLTNLIGSVNVGLAVVSALILAYEFFWQAVILAVLFIGLYVLWDNLRELRR
ncbi:MAG: hypothetical protein M3Q54_12735 [Actinomycetota bacterium]|nr:hypothetical protein [Actinomycetota bacterium]